MTICGTSVQRTGSFFTSVQFGANSSRHTGLLVPDGKDGIPAGTICSESLALEFDGHQQFIGVVLAGINDNAVISAAFGFDLNRMGLQ